MIQFFWGPTRSKGELRFKVGEVYFKKGGGEQQLQKTYSAYPVKAMYGVSIGPTFFLGLMTFEEYQRYNEFKEVSE